jgi:ribulose-phosphate 3-epimerase
LSLNLKTPVQLLEPYAGDVDHVLLVSVEADHEGLPFRPGVLEKIVQARKILPKETTIWVDGGINDANLREVIIAGADAVVMGRAVFGEPNPAATWKYYRDRGEAYRAER